MTDQVLLALATGAASGLKTKKCLERQNEQALTK